MERASKNRQKDLRNDLITQLRANIFRDGGKWFSDLFYLVLKIDASG